MLCVSSIGRVDWDDGLNWVGGRLVFFVLAIWGFWVFKRECAIDERFQSEIEIERDVLINPNWTKGCLNILTHKNIGKNNKFLFDFYGHMKVMTFLNVEKVDGYDRYHDWGVSGSWPFLSEGVSMICNMFLMKLEVYPCIRTGSIIFFV